MIRLEKCADGDEEWQFIASVTSCINPQRLDDREESFLSHTVGDCGNSMILLLDELTCHVICHVLPSISGFGLCLWSFLSSN